MFSIQPHPSINIFSTVDSNTIKESYSHLVITTKTLATQSMSIQNYYTSSDWNNRIYIELTDTATGQSTIDPTLCLTNYFSLKDRNWTISRPNKDTQLYFSLLASKVILKKHELTDNKKLSVVNSFSMKSQDDYRLQLVPDTNSKSEFTFKLIVEKKPQRTLLSKLR